MKATCSLTATFELLSNTVISYWNDQNIYEFESEFLDFEQFVVCTLIHTHFPVKIECMLDLMQTQL
jgi:hypothetical protein